MKYLNLLKDKYRRGISGSLVIMLLVCICVNLNGQSYAHLVDTEIGNKGNGLGCGYTYVGASYPFGMVQFTPSFFSPHKGFVINQLSGAGCPHMGNFPVLPISGSLNDSPNDMNGYEKYKCVNEAYAGYLSVDMADKTKAELTVDKRTGIANFIFNKNEEGTVLIGSGVNSTFVNNAMVKITSEYSCEGFSEGGEFCGSATNYRVYFAAEFNRPAQQTGTWIKHALLDTASYGFGKNSGAYFTFDTTDDNEVMYRIAISYVSIENAKENLNASNNTWDFEHYKQNTVKDWNECLSKIAVKTDDEDRKKQFYTHLYHSLIHPNIVSDVNGEYMGADYQVYHSSGSDQYSSFSVWDTYRTQSQLLAMFFPKETGDMMKSLVDFADQSGGYGRWILANIETGIMQGDPTAILIANSYAFGATDFDLQRAYYHMKRGATIPRLRSQDQEIRPHLTEYINDGHTFASMMLEYTSADFAIGQFAEQALENTVDSKFFVSRSQNWKNIYNPENNWLNSRYPNGVWKDIEHDWREATYKNYFWMVPYNLSTLIDTIGGRDYAEKRLDTLFVRLDASYEEDWFAAGNEPDFQVPWIYNWTNSPNKTSHVINRIFNEVYTSSPDGLPGNDDLGSMGAWYVFASVGLYPMIPGVGGFSVNTPQFEEVKLKLPQGDLVIQGGSTDKIYIKSLKVNGKSHHSTWIDWADIKEGGKIEFQTSKKSSTEFNIADAPPSYK
ncbi:GH92 family glycosyl hydrolase [Carboxylicivirga marina]|uniref:GH92 family glycosyl hydrolase n=1 Tax=Carboxylicivirga marina TaxID=2800988 RepID=A0ABS1HNJ0_9BACT|nr:GH92 family glycosyl hydrolase [Carboxylicivirga marina]MBK3519161.1 GH92 family glycosyl hydrolase [Carboxylicivirga marina]